MSMPFPEIIPPGSIVRLIRSDDTTPAWQGQEGTAFRIGFYTPNDGMDVIWLVNEAGEYIETLDRETLIGFFELEFLSEERNYFG